MNNEYDVIMNNEYAIRHAISFWQRAGIQYDPHVQYLQERLDVPERSPAETAAGTYGDV